jgi:membrane carboxypeptidase/penicillin-binding protein
MPYAIEVIVASDGGVVEARAPRNEKQFPAEVIHVLTRMLQGVFDEGTARAARVLGFRGAAAGKTGTSEKDQDAWFVGYTPDLVSTVWVGFDRPRSLGRSAAGVALPVWVDFILRARRTHPAAPFPEPEGLVWKTVDATSGQLVRTGCTHRRAMPFVAGTEPTDSCPRHRGGLVGLFKRLTASNAATVPVR